MIFIFCLTWKKKQNVFRARDVYEYLHGEEFRAKQGLKKPPKIREIICGAVTCARQQRADCTFGGGVTYGIGHSASVTSEDFLWGGNFSSLGVISSVSLYNSRIVTCFEEIFQKISETKSLFVGGSFLWEGCKTL